MVVFKPDVHILRITFLCCLDFGVHCVLQSSLAYSTCWWDWEGNSGQVSRLAWVNVVCCLLVLGECTHWPGWSSRGKDQRSGKFPGRTSPQTHFHWGNAPAGKTVYFLPFIKLYVQIQAEIRGI